MTDLIEHWHRWMSAMSVQVCVLVAIVLLIDRLIRRWCWPQLRAALWYLPMVKLVITPALSSPVSLARLASADSTANGGVSMVNQAVLYGLFAIWLTGAVASSLWMFRRYRYLNRMIKRPSVAHPAWLGDVIDDAADRLRLTRRPQIVVWDDQVGPSVYGCIRPVVILPAGLMTPSNRETLEHVLLHELAHIKRFDTMLSVACQLLQIVYWFHPLVWLTRRQLTTLREVCCDDAVVRALKGRSSEYRRTLLNFARTVLAPSTPSLGLITPHGQLIARLEALANPVRSSLPLRYGVTVLMFGLLSAVALPLAPPRRDGTQPGTLPKYPGCLQLRYTVIGMMADMDRQDLLADGS